MMLDVNIKILLVSKYLNMITLHMMEVKSIYILGRVGLFCLPQDDTIKE
jgi:hypothetical protein